MCALDAGIELKDSTGQLAQDVLVVINPRNPGPYRAFLKSKLYQNYLAVLFTRNPDIFIPSQQTAIYIVSLCKAIEQLLFNASFENIEVTK
jgi:hypothetical protein